MSLRIKELGVEKAGLEVQLKNARDAADMERWGERGGGRHPDAVAGH